jgi:predicted dehydrogenase
MAREHFRAFLDVPEATVAGVFSRTRARADAVASEFAIETVADSLQELHERTEADLVVIAVPELATRAITLEALRYPWTALIEKPVGYNLDEAAEIANAAGAAGRPAFAALNRRAYASTRAALAGLDDDPGARFIRILDQEDQVAAAAAGQPAKVVENWMYANSIHMIDLMRVFARGAVRAVTPIQRWNPSRPSVVVTHVDFDSGDSAIYEGVWNGPGPWAVQAMTPDQLWELRPIERAAVQRRGTRHLAPIEPDEADTAFKPGFRRQAQEAVAAALGRDSVLPTLTGGVETMRLISAIFEPG